MTESVVLTSYGVDSRSLEMWLKWRTYVPLDSCWSLECVMANWIMGAMARQSLNASTVASRSGMGCKIGRSQSVYSFRTMENISC